MLRALIKIARGISSLIIGIEHTIVWPPPPALALLLSLTQNYWGGLPELSAADLISETQDHLHGGFLLKTQTML